MNRGGGGVLGIYIGGGACAQLKKRGVLGAGTAPKGGILGAGTAPKKGGLIGASTTRKRGLRHVYNPKKAEFRTSFVKREGLRN